MSESMCSSSAISQWLQARCVRVGRAEGSLVSFFLPIENRQVRRRVSLSTCASRAAWKGRIYGMASIFHVEENDFSFCAQNI